MGKGLGWILFAWFMLLIAGVMNVIDGIAALGSKEFFKTHAAVTLANNLHTWGWIVLIWGVLQIAASVSIWRAAAFGRWFGILAAGVNIFIQMLFLPTYPVFALSIMVIDVLVIYGLAVYGERDVAA
jgi:uncharacterized membrane protein (DUF2068 family)